MIGSIKKFNNLSSMFIIYEIFMILISLAIVLLSLVDLFVNFSEATHLLIIRVDYFICGIFAIDLGLNLYFAKDKIKCIKSSLITILAVMPFSTFFRIAGILRFSNVFSIFRFSSPANIGIFTRIWIFIMKPSVIRISKFLNMARTYFNTPRKDKKKSKI